jgi:nucleoside-diphosphate-sugar epimerase
MLCETSRENEGFFKINFNDVNIVINIAPGRRTIEVPPYVNAMCKLIQLLFERGAKHLTFVSTTSVFGEQSGRLNEDSSTSPTTGSGQAHAQIENYLTNKYAKSSAVLRLAGLIGLNPDGSLRHPVSSLIKRSAIANGHQAVNLLHQADAISFISAIANAQRTGIFHACSLQHPSRKEYYSWAAAQLGLGKVDFADEGNVPAIQGKIIDASKSLGSLGLKLQYPSPFDMI